MKVWIGYGSEHSANLVVIGQFKSPKEAQEALDLLNKVTTIARADEASGLLKAGSPSTKFSDAMLKFCSDSNFMSFGLNDPEQLLYEYSASRDTDKVIVKTEELEISPFLKVFINGGAKIEVYSAHNHQGPYGRGKG
jgi:Family of unknown function (DUF6375)